MALTDPTQNPTTIITGDAPARVSPTNPLDVRVQAGGGSVAATGTQTSVASSASDVTILAANSLRRGATVYNDSAAILYLLLAVGTSSATNYSVQLPAGAYYEVQYGYTGVLKGIWASATGSARVTEFSA